MFALVSLPEQLAGVPTTAIGVALIRANETVRSDRLIDDPYAQLFVDAAANEFLGSSSPPDAALTWATLHQLAKLMTDRAVSVRFLEDYLLDAAQNGCEQVVLLGAGLDLCVPAAVAAWSSPLRDRPSRDVRVQRRGAGFTCCGTALRAHRCAG